MISRKPRIAKHLAENAARGSFLDTSKPFHAFVDTAEPVNIHQILVDCRVKTSQLRLLLSELTTRRHTARRPTPIAWALAPVAGVGELGLPTGRLNCGLQFSRGRGTKRSLK